MSVSPTIVWFRQDLRLQDNPALRAAVDRGGPVVPVYVLDDAGERRWQAGAASRWWLHHALVALDAALRARGSRLVLRRGDSAGELREIVRTIGAGAIYWNRRHEPEVKARDAALAAEFTATGLEVKHFNASLLFEPETIANKQGGPFQVFTPYWRRCLASERNSGTVRSELGRGQIDGWDDPVEPPKRFTDASIAAPAGWPASVGLDALALLPRKAWASAFGEYWQPGEAGAAKRLKRFVGAALGDYADERDRPDRDGTSMLSPWLHTGELSPRQIWAAVRALSRDSGVFPPSRGADVFLKEIGWREFAYHLLYHFPQTPELPLRAEFGRFPWAPDPGDVRLRAWQRGQTGYPIVDAGMRQLWRTGWMHNRVRMIAASFLVKHLRLPWTHGAAWFWDTLVDADLASNTLGWQWSAGCGADAAPYFRIFAPVLQGRKFDPAGDYVRRWVPELARVPAEHLHAPWEAPSQVLATAGVLLGQTYPRPIVDHATARGEALAALKQLRSG